MKISGIVLSCIYGSTENAGLEKEDQYNRGRKCRTGKCRTKTGVQNAGLENKGPKTLVENAGLENEGPTADVFS